MPCMGFQLSNSNSSQNLAIASFLTKISGIILFGYTIFIDAYLIVHSYQTVLRTIFDPMNLLSLLVAGLLIWASYGVRMAKKKQAIVVLIICAMLLFNSLWHFTYMAIIGIALTTSIIILLIRSWKELR